MARPGLPPEHPDRDEEPSHFPNAQRTRFWLTALVVGAQPRLRVAVAAPEAAAPLVAQQVLVFELREHVLVVLVEPFELS